VSPTPAELLRSFVQQQRMSFELVEPVKGATTESTLIQRHDAKTLSFALGALKRVEEARDPIRGGRYLRVVLDDGRSFALAGVGICFAPSFVNTGLLVDCPEVVCMRDFDKLHQHLAHLVDEAETRSPEAVQTMMICIAVLDGARAIGLDVSREERRLERSLERLEALGVAPSAR
jgi:hypothetical protein